MTPDLYFILNISIFVSCFYVATFWKDWSKWNNVRKHFFISSLWAYAEWLFFGAHLEYFLLLLSMVSIWHLFNWIIPYMFCCKGCTIKTRKKHKYMRIPVFEYVLTVSPLSLFLSLSFWHSRWAILCQSSQPKSQHHCDIWLPLFFVIRSNSYDSEKLAISIISSALAVGANIISHTLKAAIITEQEPLSRPANTRVNNSELIKICHVWTEKEISIGWRTHGKLPCHLASDSDNRIKHCTFVKPALIYILIWTMAERCVRSNLEEN